VLRVSTTDAVTLRGLSLTRGTGLPGSAGAAGGGLHAEADARVTLEAVEVVANRAGLGGGIYAGPGARVVLDSSVVSGNRAPPALSPTAAGGGVFLDQGAVLSLIESRVDDNTARACGGVHVGAGGRVEGDGASFVTGNTSDLAGGGLCATRGGAEISGISVLRNVADGAGGGLQLADATVADVVVRGNQTRLDGGGISGAGSLVLTRVELVNNRANVDAGGIDLPLATAVLTLDSCTLTGNVAQFPAADAGGARVNGGRLVSVGTDWGTGASGNTPTDVAFIADALTCDLVGLVTFDVQDGGGAAACP
jgi:predicted outer membrane repeat protein